MIRRLTKNDLAFAQEVRQIAGWNQLDSDWQRLLSYAPDGCFLAESEGHRAATATTTHYGKQLAWIGMVLVHPDYRRRGIATALLQHCLDHLIERESIQCVKLDATPEGMKVYEKLGFHDEYELSRWVGETMEQTDTESFAAYQPGDHRELDTHAFGADRARYLECLAQDCLKTGSAGSGFAMLRAGANARYLGPVVSAPANSCDSLIRTLLASTQKHKVYWDIPEDNLDAIDLAEELGFRRQRRLIRMWTGQNNTGSDPRLQWAIGAPETG